MTIRGPLANPDFAPFLQRVSDMKPDGLFIFVPSGIGSTLMRQFTERGMDKSGIKLIGSGDVLDDQLTDQIGEVSLGLISAYHYSDAHPSALNQNFTAGFEKANKMRANMMGVGAYDGMALIYQALAKAGGDTDGTKLLEVMKGMAWTSCRTFIFARSRSTTVIWRTSSSSPTRTSKTHRSSGLEHHLPDRPEMALRRLLGDPFDLAIMGHQRPPARCQLRAATVGAAGDCRQQRLGEAAVQVFRQVPGLFVGHFQLSPGA